MSASPKPLPLFPSLHTLCKECSDWVSAQECESVKEAPADACEKVQAFNSKEIIGGVIEQLRSAWEKATSVLSEVHADKDLEELVTSTVYPLV